MNSCRGGGWAKWMRGSGRYKPPLMEGISHGDERQGIGSTVKGTVIVLCGDTWGERSINTELSARWLYT